MQKFKFIIWLLVVACVLASTLFRNKSKSGNSNNGRLINAAGHAVDAASEVV